MSHIMLKSLRSTRGSRTNALVGEEAEEDELFYSAEIWKEDGSGDDSYSEEEEAKPDVFDTDFDESEDDGEEDSDDDERKVQKEMRREKQVRAIFFHEYQSIFFSNSFSFFSLSRLLLNIKNQRPRKDPHQLQLLLLLMEPLRSKKPRRKDLQWTTSSPSLLVMSVTPPRQRRMIWKRS